jgi:MFS family permease
MSSSDDRPRSGTSPDHDSEPKATSIPRSPQGILRTFSSFQNRNYRLFFAGQFFSQTGTWVQRIALAWLVLEITGSSLALGLVTALQFTPIMLLSLFGGVIADRVSKRPVLVTMQSIMALQALALGMLAWTGTVEVWHVYALSLVHGMAVAFDGPTRQAFVAEMVGPKHIANAVALNSSLFNSARLFGPAVGGALIAAFGLAVPFFINAASFAAVIAALLLIRTSELHESRRARPGAFFSQMREGLSFALTTPSIAMILIVMAFVGTFGYNFSLIIPLIARFVLDIDALGFGGLTSAMALGSVAAALTVAYISRPTERMLIFGASAFSVLLALIGLSTILPLTVVLLVAMGAASIVFTATANSRLQLLTPGELRGRVMSVYVFLFQGTAPIGNLFVGGLAEYWSVQGAVISSALLCAAGIGLGLLYRLRHRETPEPSAAVVSKERSSPAD